LSPRARCAKTLLKSQTNGGADDAGRAASQDPGDHPTGRRHSMMDASSPRIESLSAVTLTVADLARSTRFYESLGFERKPGEDVPGFASYVLGGGAQPAYLNLLVEPQGRSGAVGRFGGWGRVILYVSDVDAFYARLVALGVVPEFAPTDAPWGERYFHLADPDGHELSFAQPLR